MISPGFHEGLSRSDWPADIYMGVVLIVLIHVFIWRDPALLWVSWVWVLNCVRVKEVS